MINEKRIFIYFTLFYPYGKNHILDQVFWSTAIKNDVYLQFHQVIRACEASWRQLVSLLRWRTARWYPVGFEVKKKENWGFGYQIGYGSVMVYWYIISHLVMVYNLGSWNVGTLRKSTDYRMMRNFSCETLCGNGELSIARSNGLYLNYLWFVKRTYSIIVHLIFQWTPKLGFGKYVHLYPVVGTGFSITALRWSASGCKAWVYPQRQLGHIFLDRFLSHDHLNHGTKKPW